MVSPPIAGLNSFSRFNFRSRMTEQNSKLPSQANVYTQVPDGGWGWAVAVSFFFVEVFTYGIIKSFGVFFNDLMDSFDESNSRISWIISICVFVLTFTGECMDNIDVCVCVNIYR